MTAYVLRRIMLGFISAALVSMIVFALLRIAPGDVVDVILGGEGEFYEEETYDRLREELGLNRPLVTQYFVFMRDFLTLQWGDSIYDGQPIFPQIRDKLPVTLELALMSITLAAILGIPAGIVMALYQDTLVDYSVRLASLAALSVPNFWIGTMMILAGMLYFGWSPALNYISLWENPVGNIGMFILPAIATGTSSMATKSRMMRSTMLEVMRQDYIRTARAKGLKYYVVVYRHAMKNALLPVVTIIGIQMAFIMGGSVIMERLFLLPGMGSYLVYGLTSWDYPVVQTLTLVFAFWIVFMNLMVDLAYGWLDPRIRF